MQKLEVVATHMQKVLSDIKILNNSSIDDLFSQLPLYYFDDNVVDYLNELSKELFKLNQLKDYPDLLTLAFFCRKANLIHLKNIYTNDLNIKIGRGLAFHVTPSNVPMNFAYSYIAGLISGNSNIVRVPSKEFKQVDLFFDALNNLDQYTSFFSITTRTLFVKYERNSNSTEYFSSICDVRIIWGGDSTIDLIRKNKIPARSIDITFADRYSFSIINAKEYNEFNDKKKLAVGFFNDTYLFDQNACTSPQLVLWFGEKNDIQKAKEIFWSTLHEYVVDKYQISTITGIDKLTNYYSFKIHGIESKVKIIDNYLWRIELETLPVEIDKYKGNSGYFFEFNITELDQIAPIVSQKYQTLAYFGFEKEKLNEFIIRNNFKGIDRVIPIGKTAEFDLIWDGYNLIEHLTRSIQII
jgi:hypothetical protein